MSNQQGIYEKTHKIHKGKNPQPFILNHLSYNLSYKTEKLPSIPSPTPVS